MGVGDGAIMGGTKETLVLNFSKHSEKSHFRSLLRAN